MNYMLNMWDVVMNNKHNPLSQIPDFETRHMVFQLLAWMWINGKKVQLDPSDPGGEHE
jgi:hypothetical protein